MALNVNVADSVGLTDSAAQSVTPIKVNVADTTGLTDYQLINELLQLSVADSVGVTDAFSRTMTSNLLNLVINDFVGAAAFIGFGHQYPFNKLTRWKTDVISYDSGHEQRNQVWSRPLRAWPINWRVMDAASIDKLIELFGRAHGSLKAFLYKDPRDYQATAVEIETNGSDTVYQLKQRYYPGEIEYWDEDKKDIVPGTTYPPVISHSVDGAQTEVTSNPPTNADEYYLNDNVGQLVFADAYPPSAGILTCTFQYYFRVRFETDNFSELRNSFLHWRADGVKLIEVIT
jgi:uncharacterized protein (TIGR02217 family)